MARILSTILMVTLVLLGGCATTHFAMEYNSDGDYTHRVFDGHGYDPSMPAPMEP